MQLVGEGLGVVVVGVVGVVGVGVVVVEGPHLIATSPLSNVN